MTTPVRYQTDLRLDSHAGRYEGRLQALLHLEEPRTRILLRVPTGSVGRAEARFDEQSWAAAHYWTEESEDGNIVVFEFSEPLPAGDVRLVVPLSGELTPGLAAAEGASPEQLERVLPHLPGSPGDWSVRVAGSASTESAGAPH